MVYAQIDTEFEPSGWVIKQLWTIVTITGGSCKGRETRVYCGKIICLIVKRNDLGSRFATQCLILIF